MKKPDDVGRQGFYEAVQRTFSKLYPEGHDLHQGPEFGHVARELHHGSAVVTSQKAHLHGGFRFAAEHRWKRVAHYLRTKEKIKVWTGCRGAPRAPLGPLRRLASL